MDIITTTDQLRTYGSSYPHTISYIGFQRKASIDDFHEGHLECINLAKSYTDKVLVAFTADKEVFDLFFPELNARLRDVDKDACLAWCESNNIDLVFWPNDGEMAAWFDGYDIDNLKSWAENYTSTNGFVMSNSYRQVLLHLMLIMDKIRPDLNLERIDYRVGSWKEGILRFYHKYYVDNDATVSYRYLLAPIITDADNIPYENNTVYTTLQGRNEMFRQLPDILISNKNFIPDDQESFRTTVISQVNALDKSGVFHVKSLDIYYNHPAIENNKALVELHLYVGDDVGMWKEEGSIIYPFYLDLAD